jgi:hypothetical protein
VESIFATPDRLTAEAIIEEYSSYWMEIVGTRGFKGKKALNARTQFNVLFDLEETQVDNNIEDTVQLDSSALDQLEQEQR